MHQICWEAGWDRTGGAEEAYKRNNGRLEVFRKMEMEGREKEESVAARAKQRPREHVQRKGRGLGC